MDSQQRRKRGRPPGALNKRNPGGCQNPHTKYRARKKELEENRRRIRLHIPTFEKWRRLRETLPVADDDRFASLLLQLYEDKLREDPDYITSFKQAEQTDEMEELEEQEQSSAEEEIKPKRKRGRPPKNRALESGIINSYVPSSLLEMNTMMMHRGSPSGRVRADVDGAVSNGERCHADYTEEDTAHLSPAVRSARLALSRALQNSCRALSFQEQPLDRLPSPDEETRAFSSHEHASPLRGYVHPDVQQEEEEVHCSPRQAFQTRLYDCDEDAGPLRDAAAENQDRPSQDDTAPSLQYFKYVVYPDKTKTSWTDNPSDIHEQLPVIDDCTTLEDHDISGFNHERRRVTDLVHEHAAAEDPSGAAYPSQLIEGSGVGVLKVPDRKRRSRLNQITGGLLNKLKMKTVDGESDS